MSGPLRLIGVLLIIAGVVIAVLMPVPVWLRIAYGLSGVISSLVWFALAEVLDRLEAIQVMVGRPSR